MKLITTTKNNSKETLNLKKEYTTFINETNDSILFFFQMQSRTLFVLKLKGKENLHFNFYEIIKKQRLLTIKNIFRKIITTITIKCLQ